MFESEKSVRALLQACTQDLLHPEGYSEYYFKMSSRRMRCKDVSVALLFFVHYYCLGYPQMNVTFLYRLALSICC